ncbi:carbohydrate-binding family 9-like protein [Paenibacillus filicis]|uniref:Carbohydrate-binding family 9-like protein n=1 Tax=Paenibacillus gyeongsangnamensis TaxID=3388067 RepID=A0ABT4Q4S3_9BACL|nr:carbohydrate-binding family 9-like protein [Paenibacillus filicis]MCZ8511829.1 carbohydrate-binding family 9-like protein [Paenibacillus filicis]
MKYDCKYVGEQAISVPWAELKAIPLREVVTSGRPKLETLVRACWTAEALHIRFECEDDHTVATMSGHDEPLYLEDVVEVFLDLSGTGEVYYELEVSPRNVIFDAVVHNDLQGRITADTAWHAAGLQTSVKKETDSLLVYELAVPFSSLGAAPSHGTRWRWNVYRIDEDLQGVRHYSAWSPTGAVQFHLPRYFGSLEFQR